MVPVLVGSLWMIGEVGLTLPTRTQIINTIKQLTHLKQTKMPREVHNSMANTIHTNFPLLLFYEVSLRFPKTSHPPSTQRDLPGAGAEEFPSFPPRHTLLIELMLKAGSFINAEDASKKLDSARIRLESWLNDIQTKLNGTWILTDLSCCCDRAILNPQVFSGSVLGWVRGPLEISWMGWASWFVGDLGVFWSTLGCVDRSSLQKSWWLSFILLWGIRYDFLTCLKNNTWFSRSWHANKWKRWDHKMEIEMFRICWFQNLSSQPILGKMILRKVDRSVLVYVSKWLTTCLPPLFPVAALARCCPWFFGGHFQHETAIIGGIPKKTLHPKTGCRWTIGGAHCHALRPFPNSPLDEKPQVVVNSCHFFGGKGLRVMFFPWNPNDLAVLIGISANFWRVDMSKIEVIYSFGL